MRLVVLGHKGMLGTDMVAAARRAKIQTLGYDLEDMDVTDAKAVRALPRADWVVNCSAYTRVDDAESHRDLAYAVNSEGARNIARECARKRMRMLHVSTDYVFDGTAGRAYIETDQTNPVSVYGASKLAGEKGVRGEGGDYLIVRTQSLFGKHGHNFVRAIAGKLKAGDGPLRVVDDQVSAPTYTAHLAEALLRLVEKGAKGIVHVSASGECSWHAFARAIADRLKPGTEVAPIKTDALNLPAMRPTYSVLDTQKYRMLTGHVMPSWEQGLDDYLNEEDFSP